jgi:hypothetical protein
MKKVQMTLTRRAALTALGASFSSLALFSGKAGASSATTAPAVEAKFPQHFDVERLSLRRKGVDALEPLQMYRDQLSAGRLNVMPQRIVGLSPDHAVHAFQSVKPAQITQAAWESVEDVSDFEQITSKLRVTRVGELPVLGSQLGGISLVARSDDQPNLISVARSSGALYTMSVRGEAGLSDGSRAFFSLNFDGISKSAASDTDELIFDAAPEGSRVSFSRADGGSILVQPDFGAARDLRVRVLDHGGRVVSFTTQLALDGRTFDAQVNVEEVAANLALSVTDLSTGVVIAELGSTSMDSRFDLHGGMIAAEGGIVLLDAESLAEVDFIPIEGRFSGATWDGESLWQINAETSSILCLRENNGWSVEKELLPDVDGLMSGLSFDGEYLLAGRCSGGMSTSGRGRTYVMHVDRDSGKVINGIARPHVASSGILWNDGEVFAAISGLDQTPASADSGIAVLDETTGEQTAFVAFPDGFFPGEMHRDIDDSVLIAVTETTLGMDQNAVLYRISRA